MLNGRSSRGRRVRTPVVLQLEAVECGAAALGIVLAHHGRFVPLADLRRVCGVSRDGSNAAALVKAARRYGLEAKGFSAEVDALRELEPPFVVFWSFDHFLVVEGFGRDEVHLNDPACGHRRVPLEEFEDEFTGVVLTFAPGPDFERGGRPPSVVRALRERLTGSWRSLAFAAIAGFLLVVPDLLVPALTQVFLDEVLLARRGEWLGPIVTALLVAAAAAGVLKALQLTALRRLRLRLAARASARFLEHLLRLPVEFYTQRFPGEVASRSSLNDDVASVLSGRLAQAAIDAVMMAFYLALMFVYDVRLTLIAVTAAALDLLVLQRLSRWRTEANMRLHQEYGKVDGVSIAGLQGMESIKASGMEAGFFERWAGRFASATNVRREIEVGNQVLGAVPGLLSSITTLLVLVVGGLAVVEGRLTIGMLVAFQLLTWRFLSPVAALVDMGASLQELRGDLGRLDDVLEHAVDAEDAALHEPALPHAADRVRLRGQLELAGVTFGYDPLGEPLIRDFDLRVEPGRRVALVGGSGSGKSTLARIVCGLLQPWSGEVLLDGAPRGELPRPLLGASLALVDQDLAFFDGTVRDNLTLWDPSVPDETLWRACRDAELHERVRALPGGLDATLIEGAANLSGGERQRLEIARALAGNPSLLVLDEATSALDAESERAVVESVALRGCTCVVVAHRLSTIRDCDEIVVLDRGRVVERGTHEELWDRGGAYAELLRADEAAVGAGSVGAGSVEATPEGGGAR